MKYVGRTIGLTVEFTWIYLFHELVPQKNLTAEQAAQWMQEEFPDAQRNYLDVIHTHLAMYNRGALNCQGGVPPPVKISFSGEV